MERQGSEDAGDLQGFSEGFLLKLAVLVFRVGLGFRFLVAWFRVQGSLLKLMV